MLKDFWESRKHAIQLVGILCGVGALFLAIPTPENLLARPALFNIQFVWLLVVTISTTVLFVDLIRLSDRWEKEITKSRGIDITETISIFLAMTLLFMLANLWVYFIHAYSASVVEFFKFTSYGLTALVCALLVGLWKKIVVRIPEQPKYLRVTFSMISHLVIAASISGIISLANVWSLFEWSVWTVVIYVIFLVVFLIDFLRKWKPGQLPSS